MFEFASGIQSKLSRGNALRALASISPSVAKAPSAEDTAGYLKSQRLAFEAVHEIQKLIRPGHSEAHAAHLINTYLADNGVTAFFHKAFVWYGARTRFCRVKSYFDYLPGNQNVLTENCAVIFDVAPIVDGYASDIGYSYFVGEVPGADAAMKHLADLRAAIPKMFGSATHGKDVWREIDARIRDAGYDNIHVKYPFSVLGHRVHHSPTKFGHLNLINFGWQSYWEFLSRGLFGQLLNEHHEGDLVGLWAIEPHIGTPEFGAKFEEILVFDGHKAHWLDKRSVKLES